MQSSPFHKILAPLPGPAINIAPTKLSAMAPAGMAARYMLQDRQDASPETPRRGFGKVMPSHMLPPPRKRLSANCMPAARNALNPFDLVEKNGGR